MVTKEYYDELTESMAKQSVYDGASISFKRKITLNGDKTKIMLA